MYDEWSSLISSVEFQDFSIIFKELFLRVDFSTAQFLLKILFHLSIFLWNPFVGHGRSPLIIFIRFRWSLRLSNFFIELSSVPITIINIDGASINF